MPVIKVEQGSEEWLRARAGSLGASEVADALARTKSGWGASRHNLMARLMAEQLRGEPIKGYVSREMEWGTATEPEARAAYTFFFNTEVQTVGLITHPTIEGTHASPDGFVGDDGLIEVKCPNTATHIATLLERKIPARYETQMRWQMICSGRQWCDFCSYDPRMPEHLQLWVKRLGHDETIAVTLQKEVRQFLDELEYKQHRLETLYGSAEAA